MNFIIKLIFWIFLRIIVAISMIIALFLQTTPDMKDASFYIKLLSSEFWATIQWLFFIPSNKLGNTFLNPAQLSLSSYIFNFLAQLWANRYFLNLPTTIDDYTTMILIIISMIISIFKLAN
jgi:uncharacterized protein (DUF486 family)